MRRHLSYIATAAIALGLGAATTEEAVAEISARPAAAPATAAGSPFIDKRTGRPREALLAVIASWLSAEFDLPRINSLPRVALASPGVLVAVRYRALLDVGGPVVGAPPALADLVAVYSGDEHTVYLSETWSGATAEDYSVLVHEMVHHIQKVAGLTYACQEEREKPAFAAQAKWLALFGSDIETAFGIDPFTLLVRTSCFY